MPNLNLENIDLGNLSKKEKLRLYDVIQEYKRRERDKRDAYTPHEDQLKIHNCRKPFRFAFCGNGFGKTAAGANEAIWGLDGFNPITQEFTKTPSRGIVVLDSPSKVADVWLPELNKWSTIDPKQLHKRGKPHVSQITKASGSEVLFMFHEQEPMLFESIEVDWIIFDEPPPRKIWIALLRGLRKAHSNPWVLVLGTPIAAPWLRKEIYDPWSKGEMDDTECFRFSSDSNKENINWKFYEKHVFSKYSDREKQVRRYGNFFDLEGLALAHLFDRNHHLIPPPKWPPGWPVVISIDPHPRKAHVACMLGITKEGNFVFLREMTSRATPSEFAAELKEFYRGYRVVDIVCDSLGSSPLTGGDGNLSFIHVLKDRGIRVRATTYNEKQDEAFIQMIQEVLAIPLEKDQFGNKEAKLKISSDCKGIIADVENVEWLKYRNIEEFKPKLNITNRDFLATLKYALASRPNFNKGKERILRPRHKIGLNHNDKRPWRRR